MEANTKTGIEAFRDPEGHTSVTETWPGQFELEIETSGGVSTTTVHNLETAQLRLLGDQIETALDDAHRS